MPELLAIVSTDFRDRVQCGQPHCGHSVYRRIHVVRDGGELLVLGSTCFARRFGSGDAVGPAKYGGGEGRTLTEAERQLLVDNTAALLEQFERERVQAATPAQAAQVASYAVPAPEVRARPAPSFQGVNKSPWSWMKPWSSITCFQLRDGTGWMRVQHVDGRQVLVPWPTFDGWEEAMPARLGTPAPDLGGLILYDLVSTVSYLRGHAVWEKMCGLWRDMAVELAKRKSV